ncbi:MAG: 3-isopropylmalate dehydratase small subunit [Actinomycetota bacterium]|nr:3-isopropylmalate dehydratase small subunit [Actinomycetota bacterium]MDA8208754.1 3-isopropylmalate dehydratase small subunit [Actinomycetota bacterium]
MEKITKITGRGVPLERSDVDTDQIIPSDWLKRVERTGFGAGLFQEWREDPSFVLNDDAYAGASILVAGPNFGTGSSREHAVWALVDYGFKAVVSPKFGDIFYNNSTKAGLVPVVAPLEVVNALQAVLKENPAAQITVDVEELRLSCAAAVVEVEFPMNEFTRYRLIEGLDDIGLSLRYASDIDDYESARMPWLPSLPKA